MHKHLLLSISRRLVFLIACVIISSQSSAQNWKQLGGTLGEDMHCLYFFDTSVGVVADGTTIWQWKNHIWNQAKLPIDNPYYFNAIRELKPGILYATSGATYVWVSTDSGASWGETTTKSNFAKDCYFRHDSLLTVIPGTFARVDSNICIVANDNGVVPSYSSDGGITWHTGTGTNLGGYCVYGDTCRKMFYASGKTGTVGYSTDSGRSWHINGPPVTEDILNGADGAVYHQDTNTGVWCSQDAGTTWQPLKGPLSTGGDRCSIFGFGPRGKYVVAIHGGAVYLYSHVDLDTPTSPITRPDTLESCPISRIPIFVRPFTRPFQIRIQIIGSGEQSLAPTDTTFEIYPGPTQTLWYNVSPTIAQHRTFYSIFTTAYDGCHALNWEDTFSILTVPIPIKTPDIKVTNCSLSKIPIAIQAPAGGLHTRITFTADSGWSVSPSFIQLKLNPNVDSTIYLTPTAPSLPIGTLIHLVASDTVACTIYVWDTAFHVSIVPVPVHYSVVDSIGTKACVPLRVPIAFSLASCDSLAIDTLIVNPADSILTFDSLTQNSLARGQNDTLWMHFSPQGKEERTNYQLSIQSHFVPENILVDTLILVKAVSTGSPTPHVSAPSSVSVTACEQGSISVSVTAAGCEPIRVDSFQILQGGLTASTGITLPDTVAPQVPAKIPVDIETFSPGTTQLHIYCWLFRINDGIPYDTTIIVSIQSSGAGSQSLISSTPKLDLSNCTNSIVPFLLHAPCDSIVITSCDLTVDNSLHYTSNLTFPLTLGAGLDDTLALTFPPQGANLTTTMLVHIKGAYKGTNSFFDTTAQTQVTFACQGVDEQGNPSISLTSVQSGTGSLRIDLRNGENPLELRAEIFDILGHDLGKKEFHVPSGTSELEWNIGDLPTGTYYLRLSAGDYRSTSRFAISR